jgi:magnesium-transporting ATPase (P-type)
MQIYPVQPRKQQNRNTELFFKILLWLFVINLGIALGAGLYEARIVFPQWLIPVPETGYRWNAEAARQANTGLRFWIYVTTIPLTLLTLVNAIAAWNQRGKLRRWWLGAVGVALLDRIFTFSYFVPTMLRLMDGDLSETAAVSTALQWAHLNHFRHFIVLVALVAALKTFALFYQRAAKINQTVSSGRTS